MKITRFARLVIVVMVTLGVLFGGVIGLHRAAENPEACILFEGTADGTSVVCTAQ